MIGYIEGEVKKATESYAIISCGGIGYKVAATRDTLASLSPGKQVSFWTHLAVREDALDLYGFLIEDELTFFELLLSVPGIGPKSALSILDIATIETLRSAIASENAKYLTNVSGIGAKTAQKIVLELKGKVGAASEDATLVGDHEALEAMRALGYSAQEAREALRQVSPDVEGSSERLREALRAVGGKKL